MLQVPYCLSGVFLQPWLEVGGGGGGDGAGAGGVREESVKSAPALHRGRILSVVSLPPCCLLLPSKRRKKPPLIPFQGPDFQERTVMGVAQNGTYHSRCVEAR